MSKKSVVVSGMGLALGMLTNADNIRKEVGITDKQFHVLATAKGYQCWRQLFEGMKEKISRYEIMTVTVGGYNSLNEVVDAGKYDRVSSFITAERFPVKKEIDECCVEITLVHRGKCEDFQELIDEMSESGYRPATHEEILALGAQHSELQRQFPIIALGTVVCVDDIRHVLYLSEWYGRRKLNLGCFGNGWRSQVCRFAFV